MDHVGLGMRIVQGLLLPCSLFAVGTCTCYSTNPELEPAEMCYQLFERVVTTEINLFNIEELFSPSLDTVPTLANIEGLRCCIMSVHKDENESQAATLDHT